MQETDERIQVPGHWEVPYHYDIGETSSRFFVELRDNARLMGTKCPECGRILLPPQSFCGHCYVPLKDQWVEVKPEGTLEAFTIVTKDYSFTGMPDPPFVMCLVKMGKASTSIPQRLEGVDTSDPRKLARQLRPGMRVRAVFHKERRGRIDDFHVELVR